MKKLFTILLSLIFIPLYAQQSDYERVQSFKSEVSEIEDEINYITTSVVADSLLTEVDSIRMEYVKDKTLIDQSLFPTTFDTELASLNRRLRSVYQNQLVIEHQNEKIADISKQLSTYKSELTYLNNYVDSLSIMIKESQKSEENLARMVKNYRIGLEKRDELVMDFVDSLMITHYKQLQAGENPVESGSINTNSMNPLESIKSLIVDNTEYAHSTSDVLNIEDHLRMYTVQKHFSDTWNEIGGRLVTVYGGNSPDQWYSEIESGLKDWRMITSRNMWKSINNYLDFEEINTDAFDNNYSFFVALDSFIKDRKAEGESKFFTDNQYEKYQVFKEFWNNKFKNEWGELVKESEILTVSQMTVIDNELESWGNEVRPVHPFLIVLLVVTIMSIGAFIIVMLKANRVR